MSTSHQLPPDAANTSFAAPALDGQRAPHLARDALADGVHAVREHGAAALREFASDAGGLARERAQALGQRTAQMRDTGADWIRERPLQAMLIAAGTGAAVVLLAGLLSRSSRGRD